MTKTRIAVLQNGLIRGGTERFVINLCKGLDKEKFDITVINPSLRREEQVLEPEVVAAGAKVIHTTTIAGLGGRVKHLYRLYKILRQGRYDVFHTNMDLFNGCNLLVARLANVPVRICHSHASSQETELRKGRTPAITAYQGIMRWLCWHCANRHIGCSEEANDFMYRGRDWRKAPYPSVIYNGIETEKYMLPAVTDYSFEPGRRYILAVGRFVLQKNPDFILEIMEKLKILRPDIHLLWVGGGELFETIRNDAVRRGLCCGNDGDQQPSQVIPQSAAQPSQIIRPSATQGAPQSALEIVPQPSQSKEGNIEFLGWRDDIPALMQQSSLLLMPSHFEGLSITLIEAQAAGLPCLVSDTVTKQAQCGLIEYKSLSDDAQSWAETIEKMLDTDAPRPTADTQALSRFTVPFMASTIGRVIKIY